MKDQRYELMFMIPGSIEETKVPEIKQRVLAELKNFGGEVASEYDMGRRKLAFWIGAERYGNYHVLQFTMEAESVPQFDTKLRLDQEVLRYMIVKNAPKTSEELKELLEEVVEEEVVGKPNAVDGVDGADDVAGALKVEDPTTPEASQDKAVEEATPEVTEQATEEAAPAEEATEDSTTPEATPSESSDEPTEEKAEESTPEALENIDKKLDAILDDTDIESQL